MAAFLRTTPIASYCNSAMKSFAEDLPVVAPHHDPSVNGKTIYRIAAGCSSFLTGMSHQTAPLDYHGITELGTMELTNCAMNERIK